MNIRGTIKDDVVLISLWDFFNGLKDELQYTPIDGDGYIRKDDFFEAFSAYCVAVEENLRRHDSVSDV